MYYEMNVCKHALKWLIGADKKPWIIHTLLSSASVSSCLKQKKKKDEGIIMNEWEERNENKNKQKDEDKVNKK